jgi:hypothetical protein
MTATAINNVTCIDCREALADTSWPVPAAPTVDGWAGHHTFYLHPTAAERSGLVAGQVPACTAYRVWAARELCICEHPRDEHEISDEQRAARPYSAYPLTPECTREECPCSAFEAQGL